MTSSPSRVWMEEPAAPRVTMSARTRCASSRSFQPVRCCTAYRRIRSPSPRRLRHEACSSSALNAPWPAGPGSKMKGMPAAANCAVLDHALAPRGRHDANGDITRVADAILLRALHRPRMKRRDLVVIQVGGDEDCAVNSASTTLM